MKLDIPKEHLGDISFAIQKQLQFWTEKAQQQKKRGARREERENTDQRVKHWHDIYGNIHNQLP